MPWQKGEPPCSRQFGPNILQRIYSWPGLMPTCGIFEGCNHGKPWAPRSIDAAYFRGNLGEAGGDDEPSLGSREKLNQIGWSA